MYTLTPTLPHTHHTYCMSQSCTPVLLDFQRSVCLIVNKKNKEGEKRKKCALGARPTKLKKNMQLDGSKQLLQAHFQQKLLMGAVQNIFRIHELK